MWPARDARMAGGQWHIRLRRLPRPHLPRRQHGPSTADLLVRRRTHWTGQMKVMHGDDVRRRSRAMVDAPFTMTFNRPLPIPGHAVPADLRAGRPAPLLLSCLATPRSVRQRRPRSGPSQAAPGSAAQRQGRRPDRSGTDRALGRHVHRSRRIGRGAQRQAGVRLRRHLLGSQGRPGRLALTRRADRHRGRRPRDRLRTWRR